MKSLLLLLTVLTGVVVALLVAAVVLLRLVLGRLEVRQVWQLELVDLRTGQRRQRRFQDTLDMGRATMAEEPVGWMFLGGNPTISRWQCRLSAERDAVWVINASRVNVSRHNGYVLSGPQQLRVGDILKFGDTDYCVAQLYRVA